MSDLLMNRLVDNAEFGLESVARLTGAALGTPPAGDYGWLTHAQRLGDLAMSFRDEDRDALTAASQLCMTAYLWRVYGETEERAATLVERSNQMLCDLRDAL